MSQSLSSKKKAVEIIAIGASAGGPTAVQTVLKPLSSAYPIPIVVALHMPANFTKLLAKRLNEQLDICVKEAEHNEKILSGHVYLAPGGKQMEVSKNHSGAFVQIKEPYPNDLYHPSISQLFRSITAFNKKIIIVLTGMGNDGANTLSHLNKTGGCTILAESKESAVIYGMPNVANQTGEVHHVLSSEEIGKWLARRG